MSVGEKIMNPMHHLEVHRYLELDIFGFDISFTNSSLMMLGVSFFIGLFFWIALRNPSRNPGKLQYMAEYLYGFANKIVINSIGRDGTQFTPLIATLFCYIAFLDFFGVFLFSPTSHISITIPMGIIIMIVCLAISLKLNGFRFFGIFVPSGVPLIMAPLMFIIEFASYLSRPISLGLRLAANIIAGHVMLAVIGGFALSMGIFSFVPILIVVLMAMLECAVGILQAYIFSILSATYIGEAKHPH